jgi:hypothetical protein
MHNDIIWLTIGNNYSYFADNASEKDKNDFMNELNILKKVGQHPNVVCLVGACHIQGMLY